MKTAWVIYCENEPVFQISATPAQVQRLLDELKKVSDNLCWDAYAQKWGDWFDD